MRYFIDSEFIDDGKTIDLISLGIVCEDGRELYLQSVAFDPSKASKWVNEQVIDHLVTCPHVFAGRLEHQSLRGLGLHPQTLSLEQHKTYGQCLFEEVICTASQDETRRIGAYADCPWRTRNQIAHELFTFLDADEYGKPELWGWCAGYDFVALCQIFGTMLDLPAGWPHYIRELQYLLDERGIADSELPQVEGTAHHALADAKQIKAIWEMLQR